MNTNITQWYRVKVKDGVPVFGGRCGTVNGGYMDVGSPLSPVMHYYVSLDGGVPSIVAVDFQADEIEVLTSDYSRDMMSASPHETS